MIAMKLRSIDIGSSPSIAEPPALTDRPHDDDDGSVYVLSVVTSQY
jgi:hypothetical protein